MSNEFGIGLIFSFNDISDELNAIMSSPAWILPSTPSPPSTTNAPVSLLEEAAFAEITTLLFDESSFKSPVVVSMVVPSANPSLIPFALTLPATFNWVPSYVKLPDVVVVSEALLNKTLFAVPTTLVANWVSIPSIKLKRFRS